MGFSNNISEKALVACGRCCVICHKFCGSKIELHHIKQVTNGGDDTYDNCIPLCFDCHAEVRAYNPKHPKGRKYTESELKSHRDKWYSKIKDVPCYKTNDSTNYESDKKLFQDICDMFSNNIKYWLSEASLKGAHPFDVFTPFDRFQYNSDDPFCEFLDVEMEKLRGELLNVINKFMWYKAINTFVQPIGGREDDFCVTRQWLVNHENWEPRGMSYEEYSTLYEKQAQELDDLATAVWDNYCEFVRQGRRILSM